MRDFPILTNELARRIERLVAPEPSNSEESQGPRAPTVVRFGGTIASKAKGGRPANKVFCFGHDDLGHLDAILAFYDADHLEPTFYLAPMGFTRDVAAALTAAGFAQREFEQAILYGLPATAPTPAPSGVTIERVTAGNFEEYVQTLAHGFEWPGEWRDAAMEGVRSGFTADAYHFLSRYRGEAAGVASLGTRDGVVSLTGGAVVPKHRGKGCHLALVHHRLHVAHTIGCDFVLGGANFGSTSFRNQQRGGLRLAYVESAWGRR